MSTGIKIDNSTDIKVDNVHFVGLDIAVDANSVKDLDISNSKIISSEAIHLYSKDIIKLANFVQEHGNEESKQALQVILKGKMDSSIIPAWVTIGKNFGKIGIFI